jgi:hypothetical protein
MIVNKRDGIPRSQLDNGVIEDKPQVVLRTLLARLMEVVVERNIKERGLLLMLHRKRDGVKAQKKSEHEPAPEKCEYMA